MNTKVIFASLRVISMAIISLFSANANAATFEVRDSVLYIPDSCKEIPEMEFAGRLDFHSVDIPDDSVLQSIGDYAFFGCRNLKNIKLPDSLREIGFGAFQECDLRSIVIPKSISVIPRYLCAWNQNLTTASLPESIVDIGSHAFAYCSSLKDINIPARVAHIGSNLFSLCTSMEEISFPDSVTELESYILSDCSSLRHATLPANSHMIGEYLFSGCTSLLSITCLSSTPPTSDCGSPLTDDADPEFYSRVGLITLPSSAKLFESSPLWEAFSKKPLSKGDK